MDEFKTTMEELEPYTLYNCAAQLKNEKGWSTFISGVNFRTAESGNWHFSTVVTLLYWS